MRGGKRREIETPSRTEFRQIELEREQARPRSGPPQKSENIAR
jgi:hypothetical protein